MADQTDPPAPPARVDPPAPSRDREPAPNGRHDPVLDIVLRARDAAVGEAERLRAEIASLTAARDTAAAESAAAVAAATAAGHTRVVDIELRRVAADLGLSDLDMLALPSFDRSKVKVEKDGSVVGAKEAIEAFKVAKPTLFAATPASRGDTATRSAPPGSAPPAAFDALAASPADYATQRAAILRRR